jgi:hypothetical protein
MKLQWMFVYHPGNEQFPQAGFFACIVPPNAGPFKTPEDAIAFVEGLPGCMDVAVTENPKAVN